MSGVKRVAAGHFVVQKEGPHASIGVRAYHRQPDLANAGLRANGYMRRRIRRSAGECRATLGNGHNDGDIASSG